jgi:plasmid maintenance system antidote protein VapI
MDKLQLLENQFVVKSRLAPLLDITRQRIHAMVGKGPLTPEKALEIIEAAKAQNETAIIEAAKRIARLSKAEEAIRDEIEQIS